MPLKNRLALFFSIFLILTVNCPSPAIGQVLADPESVVYEPATGLYYLSNISTNTIQTRNNNGTFSLMVGGLFYPMGINERNGFLYVAYHDGIAKIDVQTHTISDTLLIPGAGQLNDLCFDSAGNLYITDRLANKIYKTTAQLSGYTVVNTNITSPNGIVYNPSTGDILVVTTVTNGQLFSVSTSTGAETLLATLNYSYLDGVALTANGNLLITSWSNNWATSQILMIQPPYSSSVPQVILTNSNGMADIHYRPSSDTLAIANLSSDSVTFIHMGTLLAVESPSPQESFTKLIPNPATNAEEVTLASATSFLKEVWGYNSTGMQIHPIIRFSCNEIKFRGLIPGSYLVRCIDARGKIFTHKLIVQ